MASAAVVVLPLLVWGGVLAWLVRCGGQWRTSEHVALIFGFLAGLVLGIVTLIAALAAVVVRARSDHGAQPERVRRNPALRPRRIVCDLLALGALSAGAIVYGNYLAADQHAEPPTEVPLSEALWWWLLLAAVLVVLGRIPLPSGAKTDLIR